MAPTPLYYWFPQIRHDGALIFGGSIDKGDDRAAQQTDAIVWTDKIVGVNKRKGALKVRYVIDNSFEEYQLRGDISKLRIGKLGIDSFFGGKFKRGLPRNWKKWVTDWKNYIEEERRQAQQRFPPGLPAAVNPAAPAAPAVIPAADPIPPGLPAAPGAVDPAAAAAPAADAAAPPIVRPDGVAVHDDAHAHRRVNRPPIPAGWRAIAVRVREIETERGVLATGFPFNVTPQEIKAFFSPLEVVSIHRSIAGAHLTGDVHITFSTTNVANQAIRKDGRRMNNRTIFVHDPHNFPRSSRRHRFVRI